MSELTEIDGIGEIMAGEYVKFFADSENLSEFENLIAELEVGSEGLIIESPISGKTFVVTGSVKLWKNRSELKAFIESKGGKVTGSVTSRTDYLINNDTESSTSKNKTAKSLGIPIISEEEFNNICGA